MRLKTIQYGIDPDTGYVWSRCGSEVMVPIIAVDKMVPEDNFAIKIVYEKMNVLDALPTVNYCTWTRKIPVDVKNFHRKLWEMKPLKEVVKK